jgi:carboxymethylenebutenolidase
MCTDIHGEGCGLGRRDFLKAGAISVAGFSTLRAAPAGAQDKQPPTRVLDDPRVEHGKVTFKHNGEATFDGYLARPKASGVFPGVLVIAGNLIAEEYIPNTCAQLALAGFVGLAPEVVHHMLDSAPDVDKDHNNNDAIENILVGMDYLRIQPFVRNVGFGLVGFCYGGWISLLAAARYREIRAVVAYHPGIGRYRDEISEVRTPVQLHQGTADESADPKTAIQLRDELAAHHVPVELFMYKGANHGFSAYTREFYRPDYARLSWSRTTKFLSKYLTRDDGRS